MSPSPPPMEEPSDAPVVLTDGDEVQQDVQHTDDSDDVVPSGGPPEVQVFDFDQGLNEWVDKGAGFANVVTISSKPPPAALVAPAEAEGNEQQEQQRPGTAHARARRCLRVEQADGTIILDEPISEDVQYCVEVGTGITFWSEQSKVEKALSFDSAEVCSAFWNALAAAQLQQGMGVELPSGSTLTSTDTLAAAAAAVSIVTAAPCGGQLVADWWHAEKPHRAALSLMQAVAEADPQLLSRNSRKAVQLIAQVFSNIVSSSAAPVVVDAITGDDVVWCGMLAVLDMQQYVANVGGCASDDDSDTDGQTAPPAVCADMSVEIQKPSVKGPWKVPESAYVHLREFASEHAVLPSLARHGELGDAGLCADDCVTQSYRCEYWVSHILTPQDHTCLPVPSATPVAAGGRWEGTVTALRSLSQELQIRASVAVASDGVFLDSVCARFRDCTAMTTAAWRLCEALLDSGGAAHAARQLDWGDILMSYALVPALRRSFQAAAEGDRDAVGAARVLERLAGGQPKGSTSGLPLRRLLSQDADEAAALLTAVAELTVKPGPAEQRAHLLEVLQRLMASGGGRRGEVPPEAADAVGRDDADPAGTPDAPQQQQAEASPDGAADGVAHPPPRCAVAAALRVCGVVLPIWFDAIEEGFQEAASADQLFVARRLVEVVGLLMERDGVEVAPSEREVHGCSRAQCLAEMMKRKAIAVDGVLSKRLLADLSSPVHAVSTAKLFKCAVAAAGSDPHVSDWLRNAGCLQAPATALRVVLDGGGVRARGMLASVLLSVFDAVTHQPPELWQEAAKQLLESDQGRALCGSAEEAGERGAAVEALWRFAYDADGLAAERDAAKQRLKVIADSAAATELMRVLDAVEDAGDGQCDAAFIGDGSPPPQVGSPTANMPDVDAAAPPKDPAESQTAVAAAVEPDEPAPATLQQVEDALRDVEAVRALLSERYRSMCAEAGQEAKDLCGDSADAGSKAAAAAAADLSDLCARVRSWGASSGVRRAAMPVEAAAEDGAEGAAGRCSPVLSPTPPPSRPQPTRSPLRRDARLLAAGAFSAAPLCVVPDEAAELRRKDSFELAAAPQCGIEPRPPSRSPPPPRSPPPSEGKAAPNPDRRAAPMASVNLTLGSSSSSSSSDGARHRTAQLISVYNVRGGRRPSRGAGGGMEAARRLGRSNSAERDKVDDVRRPVKPRVSVRGAPQETGPAAAAEPAASVRARRSSRAAEIAGQRRPGQRGRIMGGKGLEKKETVTQP
eukprot:TRINITY_DN4664_c2_g1_i1.p1 TRINITY_DN4664_c2_g1~~TRINITY_DN4664_c2_g1_i1.p1  ORF type:complete len:1248 (+),score=382.35 TRINITY_DN4664_c2_g1_i1:132-3875(+)